MINEQEIYERECELNANLPYLLQGDDNSGSNMVTEPRCGVCGDVIDELGYCLKCGTVWM